MNSTTRGHGAYLVPSQWSAMVSYTAWTCSRSMDGGMSTFEGVAAAVKEEEELELEVEEEEEVVEVVDELD